MTKAAKALDPVKEATRLIRQLEINKAPIPLEKIARHLGAVIRFSPFDDEISGMAFVKDDVPVIVVNSLQHPNRQRFTIAHEIGHLIMHRDYIRANVHVDTKYPVLMRDRKASQGTHRLEVEANRFAAELLMPREFLLAALEDDYLDLDDEAGLEALAQRFKVSKQAMSHRMDGLLSLV